MPADRHLALLVVLAGSIAQVGTSAGVREGLLHGHDKEKYENAGRGTWYAAPNPAFDSDATTEEAGWIDTLYSGCACSHLRSTAMMVTAHEHQADAACMALLFGSVRTQHDCCAKGSSAQRPLTCHMPSSHPGSVSAAAATHSVSGI